MTKRRPLQWTDEGDGRLGWPCCPECFGYMTQPGLVEAAASVGIEHGKSTGQMVRDVVDDYHARRHQPVSLQEGEKVARNPPTG